MPLIDEPPRYRPHVLTLWREWSLGLADPGTSQRCAFANHLEALTADLPQELRKRVRHLSGAQIREGGDVKKAMEEGTTTETGCDSRCVEKRSVS
jgi:hypothetical protein